MPACVFDRRFIPYFLFDLSRHIQVGKLDLPLSRTSAGELLPLVGAVHVPPHPCHLRWDLKATIFLGYDLEIMQGNISSLNKID